AVLKTHVVHEVPVGGSAAVSHAPPVSSGGTAVSHVPPALISRPRFADSIALGDGGVTLQLYQAFDAQNRLVGPRVRYMRLRKDSAFTDTDVMLQPAQNVPH